MSQMTFAMMLRSQRVEEHPLPVRQESVTESVIESVTESVIESVTEPVRYAPSRKFVALRCQDCKHWKIKGNLHNCRRAKIPAVPCNVTENSPIGGDNKRVEHQ
ncbi:Ff.00g019030.m01.CDS01 [Fusarium sp. VM40]|nr:Ff.00g019030.m01.CDS01 [Fusarium sp. VM40]